MRIEARLLVFFTTGSILTLTSIATRADLIQECGVYELIGRLGRSTGTSPELVVVTDMHSKSELRFHLGKFESKHMNLIGAKVSVQAEINEPCSSVCKANRLSNIRVLPLDSATQFLRIGLKPLRRKTCASGSLSGAARRLNESRISDK